MKSSTSDCNKNSYDYELSEKNFLDLWRNFDEPVELSNKKDIEIFLSQLVSRTNGWVILDHFSYINYDCVSSISYEKGLFKIKWKNFDEYRNKALNGELDENERMIWGAFGFATHIYMLLDVKKIKFIKYEQHLFILFLTNYLSPKEQLKRVNNSNTKLIEQEYFPDLFYAEYSFFEGEESNLLKHNVIVNYLPYFSCIIQPKEHSADTGLSRKILLNETLQEINHRMYRIYNSLLNLGHINDDEVFAKGNQIRTIMEYTLKFLLIYKTKNSDVHKKYGNQQLGTLKNIMDPGF